MGDKHSALNDVAIDASTYIERIREEGVFQLGDFVLKSGYYSPIYVDLRGLISEPMLMDNTAYLVINTAEKAGCDYKRIVGVPLAALPLAQNVSHYTRSPLLLARAEAKNYATKKRIEGKFVAGERALVVEDVVTTGQSILDTVQALRDEGLVVEEVVCVLDREQGGVENLRKAGVRLHSVLRVSVILNHLQAKNVLSDADRARIDDALKNPRVMSERGASTASWKLSERAAKLEANALNKKLLAIMNKKQSNLCIALDLDNCADVLAAIGKVKASACAIKVHADVIKDADGDFFDALRSLASHPNEGFILFEDRKLSDTGAVQLRQLTDGTARIAKWADVVTAHSTPGEEAIGSLGPAIASANTQIGGVLLVAELSTTGAQTSLPGYVSTAVKQAQQHRALVSGFICQKRCSDDPSFLYWTSGVNSTATSDGHGQQWRSVRKAIVQDGNDIVIVGRGITAAEDMAAAAREYQTAAWSLLQERD